MLISFFGLLGQSALSQTNNPVVPEADYVVYTIVANKFSGCANKKQAHLRNHLLMVSTTTKIQDTYSFQFDFTKAQEDLPFMVKSQNHFFKKPDWAAFIASIETNLFGKYELTDSLKLTCRRTVKWTPELMEYYFGKETYKNRGYAALRKNYQNFDSIVEFSEVAYSTDDNKALCYYSEIGYGLAGAEYLVFLEKIEGKWMIVESAMQWVA